MPWQLSALLYVFLSSSRSIQNRRIGLLKRDLTLYTLVSSFVCVASVGVVYALLSWESVDHQAARSSWAFLLFGGVLFGSLNVLTIKLYRLVPASVAVFMSLLNTLSVVFVAFFFTTEILTDKQWIGAGVLLSTVVLVSFVSKKKKKKEASIVIGALLALTTALLFGPAIVNEKYLIDRIGLETYVLYGWGLQAASAFTLAFVLKDRKTTKNREQLTIREHLNVWAYGALLGLAGMFFVLSLRNSGSSSLTSITSTARVAVTVFIAYFLLKERESFWVKLCGIMLTAVGLYLLFS